MISINMVLGLDVVIAVPLGFRKIFYVSFVLTDSDI